MPELLSPAGNFEKMVSAIRYGADAVYLAGNDFGMRAAAANFTLDELKSAVEYAHARKKRVHLTVNTMPHDDEYPRLSEYLDSIKDLGIDAFIVADIGVINLILQKMPNAEIHLSTQASTLSSASCRAWHSLGVKRVVLARELNLEEIKRIRENTPPDLQLEAFIHGSMCISLSGRCLLSNYLCGRDANRGACAQPCRWDYEYTIMQKDEELGISENKNGTFIMASKDMCLIEHIPKLLGAGIDSFKIEGRMKSAYYTAVVTNTYRMAIDSYLKDKENYKLDPRWCDELDSVSHREYCTGYYFDSPHKNAQTVSNNGYLREKAYLAMVDEVFDDERGNGKFAVLVQRNKFSSFDDVELLTPGKCGRLINVGQLKAEDGEDLESVPHPYMRFKMKCDGDIHVGDILRGTSK